MGRTGVLVAVHALKVEVKPSLFRKDPLTALRKKANIVSNVRVDGGQMAVLDQAVRNEERFEDELSFRTRTELSSTVDAPASRASATAPIPCLS